MTEELDWEEQVEMFLKRIQARGKSKNMKPCPRGVIRRIHQRIETQMQLELETETKNYRHIPERLFRSHQHAVERNTRRCEQAVRDLLGKLCEKYRARHGWLFTHETEGTLQARFAYRSNLKNQRIRLDQRSIISHVYLNQCSYAASDTSADPHYLNVVGSTRSQLSAAIVIACPQERDRVIGVVNLEADQVGRFTPEMREEFEVDVQELALPLLLLEGVDDDDLASWPLLPRSQGWRCESVLKHLCDEFLRHWTDGKCAVALSATVWYVDWRRKTLWALATNGYDFEFLTKTLPLQSFTGTIAQAERGIVKRTTPAEEPLFLEREKAEAMGVQRILATSIHPPHGRGPALGTFNLYQFHDAEPSQLPSPATVRAFSVLLANVMPRFEELREAAACAYLDWKMRAGLFLSAPASQPGVQLHVLMEVFRECLGADGCSILMADESENWLNIVTSSGVREERIGKHEGRWVSLRTAVQDLPLQDREREGILSRLYWHPGKSLRINDVEELVECPVEDASSDNSEPATTAWEHLTPDPVERRFLGIGMRLSERARIVVRLVRSMNSPRFTAEDAELLQRLAEFCRRQEFWDRCPGRRTPQRSEKQTSDHEIHPQEEVAKDRMCGDALEVGQPPLTE